MKSDNDGQIKAAQTLVVANLIGDFAIFTSIF
jgi:hypothetical protein